VSYAVPEEEPGGATPAVLSALVHAAFAVVLVFGLRWQAKHPDAVVVELWSELPVIDQPPPRPEPKVEPKPEIKPPPKPIESKVQKPDIVVEREKKAPKKQPKKEEPPLKFDTTDRIREQLAQEQRALKQTLEKQEALKQLAPPAAPPSPDAGYVDRIRSKIKMNIVLPSDIKGNPEAIFNVIQLPTGEVLEDSVRLVKSSGNKLYDEAVERAIRKSSPLPKPDRPDQFRRELQLKFRPQE
jgi:colicin import membrane protein